MRARTIDDINVADVVAFTSYQCRQETVKSIEAWQTEKNITAERLKPAARVTGSVAQHRAAYGIGDT